MIRFPMAKRRLPIDLVSSSTSNPILGLTRHTRVKVRLIGHLFSRNEKNALNKRFPKVIEVLARSGATSMKNWSPSIHQKVFSSSARHSVDGASGLFLRLPCTWWLLASYIPVRMV